MNLCFFKGLQIQICPVFKKNLHSTSVDNFVIHTFKSSQENLVAKNEKKPDQSSQNIIDQTSVLIG